MPSDIDWSLVKYFEPWEFECKCGCGTNNPSKDLVYKINSARIYAGIVFNFSSACRCHAHNLAEGGLPDSAHIASETEECEAVDIEAETSEQKFIVVEALIKAGFKRIFIYNSFVHGDVDNEKPSPALRSY